jgi:hypothetical protein
MKSGDPWNRKMLCLTLFTMGLRSRKGQLSTFQIKDTWLATNFTQLILTLTQRVKHYLTEPLPNWPIRDAVKSQSLKVQAGRGESTYQNIGTRTPLPTPTFENRRTEQRNRSKQKRVLSSGTQRSVVHWKPTAVSEEHVACYLLLAGFLLGLFSDPEDGGDMFLRNVSWLSTDYNALYTIRQNSS